MGWAHHLTRPPPEFGNNVVSAQGTKKGAVMRTYNLGFIACGAVERGTGCMPET
jgi:hypothetical protein